MITTIIITLFLGIVSMIDAMLGALLPLRGGILMFNSMISTLDNVVFYVRSIFPLTISTIFFYMFLGFSVFIMFKFISMIKTVIPYLNRFGGGVGDTRGGSIRFRGKEVKVRHWQD